MPQQLDTWYVDLNGRWAGPWPLQKIRLEILVGHVTEETLVRLDSTASPCPAGQFEDLFPAEAKNEDSGYDVFVSHSALDKDFANAIVHQLERDKVRCWIAPRDIQPGSTWAGGIMDGIQRCKVFLLVFTDNSNTSRPVLSEVERAVNRGLIILPFKVQSVQISQDLEFLLSTHHWMESMDPPLEEDIRKLSKAVQSHLLVEGRARTASGASSVEDDEEELSSRLPLYSIIGAFMVIAAAILFWFPFGGEDPETTSPSLDSEIRVGGGDSLAQEADTRQLDSVDEVQQDSTEQADRNAAADGGRLPELPSVAEPTPVVYPDRAEQIQAAKASFLDFPGLRITFVDSKETAFVSIQEAERGSGEGSLVIFLASHPGIAGKFTWAWGGEVSTEEATSLYLPLDFFPYGVVPPELAQVLGDRTFTGLVIDRATGDFSVTWGGRAATTMVNTRQPAEPAAVSMPEMKLGSSWEGRGMEILVETAGDDGTMLSIQPKGSPVALSHWDVLPSEDPWWPLSLRLRKGEANSQLGAGLRPARVVGGQFLVAGRNQTLVFESMPSSPRLSIAETLTLDLAGSRWEGTIVSGKDSGQEFLLSWLTHPDGSRVILLQPRFDAVSGAEKVFVSLAFGRAGTEGDSFWPVVFEKDRNPVVLSPERPLFGKKAATISLGFLDENRASGLLDGKTQFRLKRAGESEELLRDPELMDKELRSVFAVNKKYSGTFQLEGGRTAYKIHLRVSKKSVKKETISLSLSYPENSAIFEGEFKLDSLKAWHWPIRVRRTRMRRAHPLIENSKAFGKANRDLFLRLGADGVIYGYCEGEIFRFFPDGPPK